MRHLLLQDSSTAHLSKAIFVVLVAFVFFASSVSAESENVVGAREEEPLCSGYFYQPKRDDVAVYDEPDLTAAVIARLDTKEKVCYVGEQDDFAILDWSKRDNAQSKKLAFVRLVDLWKSDDKQSNSASSFFSLISRVKGYVHYVMSGGVPEDPLLPYRPLINPFMNLREYPVKESEKDEHDR